MVRRGTDADTRTDGLDRASKKHALLRSGGNMLFGSGILLQRMMHAWGMLMPRERKERG